MEPGREPFAHSPRPSSKLPSRMTTVTYTSAAHGFGVTYDGAWLTHVDDPGDPRLAAAWTSRIPTAVAASVLFVAHGVSAADIARGRAPSQLITTDDTPVSPRRLGAWDWDEEARRAAAPFLEWAGAEAVEATAVYWRGYPVLQLSAVPALDSTLSHAGRSGVVPPPVEILGLLHTPQQTFAALLTMPADRIEELGRRFQTLMDGFYLVPIEREGHVRTGHQPVRTWRVEARDLRDDLAAR